MLGLREVQAVADPALAKAAEHALAKLYPSLPPRLKGYLKHQVLQAKQFSFRPAITIDVRQLREAAWLERATGISYLSENSWKLSKLNSPSFTGNNRSCENVDALAISIDSITSACVF